MMSILRSPRRFAALVALGAISALGVARANHFILPCRQDCTDARWKLTGSLNEARAFHTATLLDNGRVLVAGGESDSNEVLSSAELYDPSTGEWTATGSMTTPRAEHFAFALPDGNVVAIGGNSRIWDQTSITAELYDPRTGVWTASRTPGPALRFWGAAMLPSGVIFVTGVTAARYPKIASWLYYPGSFGAWERVDNDPVWRAAPDAIVLPSGEVLVVDGQDDPETFFITPGAELYDPATGVWRSTDGPSTPGGWSTHTVLPDGSVLAAGGLSGDATLYPVPLRRSESYGPDGRWRAVGNLNEARWSHTASLLPDGRVLIAGGERWGTGIDFAILNSVESYDPATEAWSYENSLNVGRLAHTATVLVDGTVLVAGGAGWSGDGTLASAEIYVRGDRAKAHSTWRSHTKR